MLRHFNCLDLSRLNVTKNSLLLCKFSELHFIWNQIREKPERSFSSMSMARDKKSILCKSFLHAQIVLNFFSMFFGCIFLCPHYYSFDECSTGLDSEFVQIIFIVFRKASHNSQLSLFCVHTSPFEKPCYYMNTHRRHK